MGAALLLPLFTTAQDPLAIGEKMPDWTFTPLVNGNKELRLSDHKNKGIMICFWSATCGASLQMLTKTADLQQTLGKDFTTIFMAVNSDTTLAATLLEKRPSLKALNIPLMKRDTALLRLFPYTGNPYVVLIGKDGRIKALTNGASVTRESLQDLLDGKNLDLPKKRPHLSREEQTTLFGDGLVENHNLLFSTVITGYIQGLAPGLGWHNPGRARERVLIANSSLQQLYLYAYGADIPEYWFLKPKHLLVEAQNKAAFHTIPGDEKTGHYCYEKLIPQKERQNFFAFLAADLDRFFSLRSGIEKRTAECWLLRPAAGRNQQKDSGETWSLQWPGFTEMKNVKLAAIASHLNQAWPAKIILFEKEHSRRFTLNLKNEYSTEAELKKELKEKGLELVPVKRSLNFIVIRDA